MSFSTLPDQPPFNECHAPAQVSRANFSTYSSPSNVNQMGPVIVKIEKIMESMLDSANKSAELTIPLSRRPSHRDGTLIAAEHMEKDVVSFPGKSEAESKLFAQVLSILQLSHQALLTGKFVTKRNIFYQCRELFKDQRTVDRLVDDIAYTLGFGRDSFNIVASSVGIVSGNLSFIMKDGLRCCAYTQESGFVIPPLREVQKLNLSNCQWILVIEKEATFRTLSASRYWNTSMAGPGVLVTSKGYPTLVTRSFLHYIQSVKPGIPVYGLVDYDPHGIRIFRTYQCGSISLNHEQNITVPDMKWLGLRSADLIQNTCIGQGWSVIDDAMPLDEADRRTAVGILREGCSGSRTIDVSSVQCLREVQVMMMLNIKAEIQAADDHGDLTAWLDEKLRPAPTIP